ncbi:MAG: SIMPL domain-containing protein [Acidimicrobiia bacterium]
MKKGITVSATGEVLVKPDQAIISLAASAVRAEAASAMTEVSRRVEALLAAMSGAGIDQRDVQTTDLSLWPQTDRSGTPIGYRAHNGVRIFLSDVSRTGEVVASGLAALGEGAEIGGVSFGRRDVDDAETEARAVAWQKATTKARQLGNQAGLTLGRPLSIEESTVSGMLRPMARLMAEAVPVEAGSTTVTVTLVVRFALVG